MLQLRLQSTAAASAPLELLCNHTSRQRRARGGAGSSRRHEHDAFRRARLSQKSAYVYFMHTTAYRNVYSIRTPVTGRRLRRSTSDDSGAEFFMVLVEFAAHKSSDYGGVPRQVWRLTATTNRLHVASRARCGFRNPSLLPSHCTSKRIRNYGSTQLDVRHSSSASRARGGMPSISAVVVAKEKHCARPRQSRNLDAYVAPSGRGSATEFDYVHRPCGTAREPFFDLHMQGVFNRAFHFSLQHPCRPVTSIRKVLKWSGCNNTQAIIMPMLLDFQKGLTYRTES